MASNIPTNPSDTVELLEAADAWVDANFNQPTAHDRLLIYNAFLTAAVLTAEQNRRNPSITE